MKKYFIIIMASSLCLFGCGSLPSNQAAKIDQTILSEQTIQKWQEGLAGIENRKITKSKALRTAITSEWLIKETQRKELSINPPRIQKAKRALLEKAGKNLNPSEEFVIDQLAEASAANELINISALDKIAPPTQEEVTKAWKKGEGPRSESSRNVEVIIANSKNDAAQAKQRLDQNQPFPEAAKKLGIWRTINDLNKSSALGTKIIFDAKVNTIYGPIKQGKKWIVFVVTSETKGTPLPFSDSIDTITKKIYQDRQTGVLEDIRKQIINYWRPLTVCGNIKISVCENGPNMTEKLN